GFSLRLDLVPRDSNGNDRGGRSRICPLHGCTCAVGFRIELLHSTDSFRRLRALALDCATGRPAAYRAPHVHEHARAEARQNRAEHFHDGKDRCAHRADPTRHYCRAAPAPDRSPTIMPSRISAMSAPALWSGCDRGRARRIFPISGVCAADCKKLDRVSRLQLRSDCLSASASRKLTRSFLLMRGTISLLPPAKWSIHAATFRFHWHSERSSSSVCTCSQMWPTSP